MLAGQGKPGGGREAVPDYLPALMLPRRMKNERNLKIDLPAWVIGCLRVFLALFRRKTRTRSLFLPFLIWTNSSCWRWLSL
ncbi:hypothetical protein SB30_190212 [Klebsiella quasipneumoniae subsp. similipneumoniae]|nr:hypothetical protein SB30_190212 [Klebsiella quasipneumoniae subsp. similipneumoniae]